MKQDFTLESIKRLYTYPFQDPRWKEKLLVASLIAFLFTLLLPTIILALLPSIFLSGYLAEIMRRIIVKGSEPGLPEWGDWGDLFTRGFRLQMAGLVYSLPMILLLILSYGTMFAMPFLGSAFESGALEESPVFAGLTFISMFGSIALLGIAMLFGIVLGVFMPAILGHVVATDQFSAAFKVREWWAIFRANLSGFLLSYVLVMGTTMVLSFAIQLLYMTVILCCLMPVALAMVTAYTIPLSAALYGTAYRDGVAALSEPTGARAEGSRAEITDTENAA